MSKVGFAASKAPSGTANPDRTKILGYLGRSPLTLPDLPFKQDALEPAISARTIGFHYGKHHRAYFDNLHKLIDGTPLASQSLEEVVFASHGRPELEAVFNNAAQAWNHNFYWNSLSPTKTTPDDRLRAAIARKFGSIDALSSMLAMTAAAQFGSGWVWLVACRTRGPSDIAGHAIKARGVAGRTICDAGIGLRAGHKQVSAASRRNSQYQLAGARDEHACRDGARRPRSFDRAINGASYDGTFRGDAGVQSSSFKNAIPAPQKIAA